MPELILLRHAEPQSAGLYIGSGTDVPLTPKGIKQAELAAEYLAAQIIKESPITLISSPLARAMQTASAISSRTKTRITTDSRLSETHFGKWEGKSWKEISARYPKQWNSWIANPWEQSPPDGETLESLKQRISSALGSIKTAGDNERIITVTHGGVIRMFLLLILDQPEATFFDTKTDYAYYYRIHLQKDRKPVVMESNKPAE